MDSAALPNLLAGPSSEGSTPSAHEEGHISVTTSTTTTTGPASAAATSFPKCAIMPPLISVASSQSDGGLKDARNASARAHEDGGEPDQPGPRLRSSRLFKGKGKDAVVVEREQKKPLRLLDLPVDILKEIVKEVTHTNDLTSLALCHSALHRLTVPHIYSRFDIVWPDSSTHAEPRSGVDALTYGLATLVMAEEIFGESPGQQQQLRTNRFNASGRGVASDLTIRRRRGNHYAQFTRKFSLGNGPAEWVQEYLITKEGGKMLGTLVALAIARMRSLETFIWDMPTGILRDVWMALSSLDGRNDGKPCRLDKVWVRWHDNSTGDAAQPLTYPPSPANFQGTSFLPGNPVPNSTSLNPAQQPTLARVERPTFSILPPLKSLSVLDIDELAYVDEMAVLIGRSLDKLRELRVGIARRAVARQWVSVWQGDGVLQVDPDNPTAGSYTIGDRRFGGVLGILTGFVHDMQRAGAELPIRKKHRRASSGVQPAAETPANIPNIPEDTSPEVALARDSMDATSLQDMMPDFPADESDGLVSTSLLTSDPLPEEESFIAVDEPVMHGALDAEVQEPPPVHAVDEVEERDDLVNEPAPALSGVLRLECLELERVPICIPVIQKTINWPYLTSLTLLNCPYHEQLWKTLRRTFEPTPAPHTYSLSRRTPHSTPRKAGKVSASSADVRMEYQLNLKKIHTNTVSSGLISFLKETLAPNSLEVLFLQESRNYASTVTIESIFRGPLRRHRDSLKKVLIDSSEKNANGTPASSSRWRRWILSHDILDFICSGKMPALRELGMALDYRDWHFFLQSLPSIPHLRSLYIPFMADHVHGTNVDPRELALQIVDIVALRPEIELCYMGIATKCFEILENRRNSDASWPNYGSNAGDGRPDSQLGILPMAHGDGGSEDDEEDDDDAADDEDEADEEADEDGNDDTESEMEEDEDDDDDGEDGGDDSDGENSAGGRRASAARLRLREILFYDDKVAIFKARHGRL